MPGQAWVIEVRVDEPGLTRDELCRACGVSPDWIEERVRAGLLTPWPDASAPGTAWRFDSTVQLRVRSMRRVERDFDAVPELAALVADLQDEIRRLRRRLHGED